MKLIDLNILKYQFLTKPLLIGGKAMEYYGLRKAGDDIDFVIKKEDFDNLVKLYPKNKKDLFGDLGICIFDFEIWLTISYFDYDFLSEASIDQENYRIISLEKLLFSKTLSMCDQKRKNNLEMYGKYQKDVELLVKKIEDVKTKEFNNES